MNLQLIEKEVELLSNLLHEKCTFHLNMVTRGELEENNFMINYHTNKFEEVNELLKKVEVWIY